MDKQDLRRVQLAMLEIAEEIKRVCNENNISYFLDSGTLIGAARHAGFIPWDDDLDIGMLRPEYERFIRIAPEKLKDCYYLQTWTNDEGYSLPFAKVRKKGTIYVEAVSQATSASKELFVDVLPYDEMPNDTSIQLKTRREIFNACNTLFMKCKMKPWMHHANLFVRVLASFKYLPFKVKAIGKTKEELRKRCLQVMTQFDGCSTGYVYENWGANAGGHLIPVQFFKPYTEIPFEGELFKVPANYDGVLRAQYGDYMQLPPENQRENRHQILELKL